MEAIEKEKQRIDSLLSHYKEKLKVLNNLTASLNTKYNEKSIIELLENTLDYIIQVKDYLLLIKKEEWEVVKDTTESFQAHSINIDKAMGFIGKIQNPSKVKHTVLSSFDYVIPITLKGKRVAYLLLKNIPADEIGCTELEKVQFAHIVLNLMILSLENNGYIKLSEEKSEKEQLLLAAKIQEKLIPKKIPTNKKYAFGGQYRPFYKIGGDYYDIIPIDKNKVVFCICDIAGKGMSGAILMSNFQASLRVLLPQKLALKECVEQLNVHFSQITEEFRYVSMFIGIYDANTKELEYINAGHNPPVLKNGSSFHFLEKGCSVLGLLPTLGIEDTTKVKIEKDSLLVMYTDGLSEITNNKDEEFGVGRIMKFMQTEECKNVEEFARKMLEKAEKFRGHQPILDDTSVLVAKFF